MTFAVRMWLWLGDFPRIQILARLATAPGSLMNRRTFIGSSLCTLGAGVTTCRTLGASWDFGPASRQQGSDDSQNRSRDRDPIQLQKSTVVVDGLDVSALDENYLRLLSAGGVNCWHKSVDGLDGFSALYRFLD